MSRNSGLLFWATLYFFKRLLFECSHRESKVDIGYCAVRLRTTVHGGPIKSKPLLTYQQIVHKTRH